LQGRDRFNELLNAADIHLLPQGRNTKDFVMPSKLGGMLASGRPVLSTAHPDTQIALILKGRGLVVPPADPTALYAAASELVENAELRAQFGRAGREYAVENLGKERVLRRFEQDMLALVSPPETGNKVQLAPSYRG
jgi:colanic acid biosynthesis glycosyl transferase WcaI